jgi:hypothetical protein
MTLKDTHLVVLSAAAAHADLLVPASLKVRGNLRTATDKLVELGYLDIVAVGRDDPAHGGDAEGFPTGLRITQAGLGAIGVGAAIDADQGAEAPEEPGTEAPLKSDAGAPSPARRSKRDSVIALLQRDDGASLDELMAETGWLPHTVRAALSGLRKSGLAVERRSNGIGQSRYRIIVPATSEVVPTTSLTVEA